MKVDFNLYLITDRLQTAGGQLPAVVADALAGGVKCVQLREKDLSSRQLFELAVELRQITRKNGARLLINDRIDVAMAVDADGVHLGISGMPVSEARRILGADRLIGYSSHGVEEALQAESDGADFVTFGPVYFTQSKAVYGEPVGLEKLRQAATELSIPLFALGGVKKTTIEQMLDAGARGIAVISAIISDQYPEEAAKNMLDTIKSCHQLRNTYILT